MGDKWLDEEVLENTLGFSHLRINKIITLRNEMLSRQCISINLLLIIDCVRFHINASVPTHIFRHSFMDWWEEGTKGILNPND